MIKYGDLDLKKIREAADLDFAHYTYKRGMCSCCYGPTDLPAIYWKNRKILDDKMAFDSYVSKTKSFDKDTVNDNEYTYLLFKNASNGSGCVTKNDFVEDACISWGFPMAKLDIVCSMLQEQLGDDYIIEKPLDYLHCISLICKKYKYRGEYIFKYQYNNAKVV